MEQQAEGITAGLKLYQAVWQLVGDSFFDRARLAKWNMWEHRFDDCIRDEESALPYIDQMLASLNDRHTQRVDESKETTSSVVAAVQEQEVPASVQSVLRADGIAYIRISSFDNVHIAEQTEDAVKKIASCAGVILDLRQNSGGWLHHAIDCCTLFVREGLLSTVEYREGAGVKTRQYFVNDKSFFVTETMPDGTQTDGVYPRRRPLLAGKPVVVIVNRRTVSAGEVMATTIVQNGEDGKALIVGTDETPGKGIGQTEFNIEGKIKVSVTRCHWFTPGGDWLGDCGQTTTNGIKPNVLVENPVGMETFIVALKELKAMLKLSVAA